MRIEMEICRERERGGGGNCRERKSCAGSGVELVFDESRKERIQRERGEVGEEERIEAGKNTRSEPAVYLFIGILFLGLFGLFLCLRWVC